MVSYGPYSYSGLVRQFKGFFTVSAYGTCRILDSTGSKGGAKPCLETRETAALRRGIQKPRSVSWDRTETVGALAHGFTN